MFEKKTLAFFRNWYELAEMQTTDEARLAFYDTIMRYAFGDVEPEKPQKDGAKNEKAAYFAFLTVQPVIDSAKEKSAATRRASMKRWDNASHDAQHVSKSDAQKNAQHVSKSDAQKNAQHVKKNMHCIPSLNNKNRIEQEENKNRIEQQQVKSSPPTKDEFMQQAPTIGITDASFAGELYDTLHAVGWTGGDGKPIDNWRRYAKAAWNDHRREKAAAAQAPAEGEMERVTLDSL